MPTSLDGSVSAFPIDRRGCFSQPFLVCCFAERTTSVLILGRPATRSCVLRHSKWGCQQCGAPFRMRSMKWQSIVEWYRILRVHHHWPLFEAIRYALWLAR
jgi:hypothetical protein